MSEPPIDYQERTLDSIKQIAVDLDDGPELRTFYGRLSERLASLIGAESAGLARLNPDGDTLHFQRDAFHVPDVLFDTFRAVPADREGKTMVGRMVYHSLFVRTTTAAAKQQPEWRLYGEIMDAADIRDFMAGPWGADLPLGAIFAYNSVRPEGFSDLDVWTLRVLGEVAGLVWRLRANRDDVRRARRHALRLNDQVVQRLVAAEMALDLGQPEQSRDSLEAALAGGRRMIDDLITEVREGRPFAGGELRQDELE